MQVQLIQTNTASQVLQSSLSWIKLDTHTHTPFYLSNSDWYEFLKKAMVFQTLMFAGTQCWLVTCSWTMQDTCNSPRASDQHIQEQPHLPLDTSNNQLPEQSQPVCVECNKHYTATEWLQRELIKEDMWITRCGVRPRHRVPPTTARDEPVQPLLV